MLLTVALVANAADSDQACPVSSALSADSAKLLSWQASSPFFPLAYDGAANVQYLLPSTQSLSDSIISTRIRDS